MNFTEKIEEILRKEAQAILDIPSQTSLKKPSNLSSSRYIEREGNSLPAEWEKPGK